MELEMSLQQSSIQCGHGSGFNCAQCYRPENQRAALCALVLQISQGREFPDAAFSVARQYRVNQSVLEGLYDDYCAALNP